MVPVPGPTERARMMVKAGRVASAGYFMVAALTIGALGGMFIDSRFETAPWGLLLGFVFGVGAGVKELWFIARTTRFNDEPGSPP